MITNLTQKTTLATSVVIADTPLKRMQGLLTRDSLSLHEALVIPHCQSIHMFFMKFPIDVVFIDSHNKVIGLTKNIKPFRMSPIFWKAKCAIELSSGIIETTKTVIGDQIQIS